jgi:hypothetical protein
MTQDAPGTRGNRSRNHTGTLRRKRGDTHVASIEQHYGVNFGVRSDMHLETLLHKRGAASLNDLLHVTPERLQRPRGGRS